ncbi:ATP-binding protein [Shewanella sp. N2AIL]|uniref:sensor histidine kinase n=1 Tax=Shewanella TaxID=22 RepID=UPI000D3C4E46|nr:MULTISPECIES: ATP-binding protein [Shewanella]MCI2964196.1 ATP-binding protein [Shewanella sp. N2AIL]
MDKEHIELIHDSLHELRYFNQSMITASSRLAQSVRTSVIGEKEPLNCSSEHAEEIRKHVENLAFLTKLSTTRLDFIEYELNPDFFSQSIPYEVDLYNKFFSAKSVLNSTCKKHKVKVKLESDIRSHPCIMAVSLIDILPFLLLDNAIKYSPNEMDVVAKFIVYNDSLEVEITSFGPHVQPDEIKKLFLKGYRGKNAKLLNIHGKGIGFYFADRIVKLHDGRLTLDSDASTFSFNNVKYSKFKMTLKIPLAKEYIK